MGKKGSQAALPGVFEAPEQVAGTATVGKGGDATEPGTGGKGTLAAETGNTAAIAAA